MTPEQARQASYGPWEFHTEKWELAYIKRIDATIAALKSAGVPVIWVGLPSQRGHQGQRRFVLSQRALPQPRREGGHRLCRYLGRLRRRGRPVLAARAGLRRPDPPPAHRRRRLFHQVRRAQARALCRARDPAHHRQPRHVGCVAGAGRCRPAGAERQAGRSRAASLGRTGDPADGGSRRAGRADRQPRAPAPAVDTTATRVLTKGEPIAAPSGRADDFSWPRGNVTLEPAVNDPAATPDSAARTAKPRRCRAHRRGGCPGRSDRRNQAGRRRAARGRARPTPTISSARSLGSAAAAAAGSDEQRPR